MQPALLAKLPKVTSFTFTLKYFFAFQYVVRVLFCSDKGVARICFVKTSFRTSLPPAQACFIWGRQRFCAVGLTVRARTVISKSAANGSCDCGMLLCPAQWRLRFCAGWWEWVTGFSPVLTLIQPKARHNRAGRPCAGCTGCRRNTGQTGQRLPSTTRRKPPAAGYTRAAG